MNLELCFGGPSDGEVVTHECMEAPEKWVVHGEKLDYIYKRRETSKMIIEEGCVATLDGPVKYDYQGCQKLT